MRKISSVIYSTSIDAKIIKNVYKHIAFFSKHEYFFLRPEYRAINRHFLFSLEFIFKESAVEATVPLLFSAKELQNLLTGEPAHRPFLLISVPLCPLII